MAADRAHLPLPGSARRSGVAAGRAEARIRSYAGVEVVAVGQLRVEHFAGSVPWRRWRSYHGQPHLSGSYWAATVGAHVVYESRLELARLLLADFDPQVRSMWAQPCLLTGVADGVERRHVPDFLFASSEGAVTVVNVKPAQRLQDPKVAAALAWPGEVFRAHGWGYEIWSGGDPVMVENVRFLAGYRRRGVVDEALLERVWSRVVDGDAIGVLERRAAGDSPGWTVRPAVLALLWRHRLVTDLQRPLSAASIVWRRS